MSTDNQQQMTPLIGNQGYSNKYEGYEEVSSHNTRSTTILPIQVNEHSNYPVDLVPPLRYGTVEKSSKKIIAVVFLFIISLVSFVSQTEITAYLYSDLNFNQPYLLLFLTHGSWVMIWPIQVIIIAIFKHFKRKGLQFSSFKKSFTSSIKNQHRNIFKTSMFLLGEELVNDNEYPKSISEFFHSRSIQYVIKYLACDTLILTVAGCTWYVAMAIAPASDITAIYNCSAFSALIFAIPILKEKFTYLKLSSVLLAIMGVFCVAYGGENNDDDSSDGDKYPNRIIGDLIIALGAVLYGLYEVLYKYWVCPSSDVVSSRRQVSFSNFCASIIGGCTLLFVWVVIVIAHVTGVSRFSLPTGWFQWMLIATSVVSNLIFSLSFLSLMSLTSPVLSSVSSLVTILMVGLFEYVVFDIKLGVGQIIGDLFVVVGFTILSVSYWKEISEEDIDEEEDDEYSLNYAQEESHN
ncbi:hypothetical protein WICPIJ_001129 [Wickerhamomyces pijperi]|uniref:EamA domain-containing protein n=1 Tax=Wickerhamomyces pijperi TaxID=599730 RepID=A0A9P8QED6_WICPI|nr:hypothetical protein WICPIJ_001129 [Wickerhamomyces pijperi]